MHVSLGVDAKTYKHEKRVSYVEWDPNNTINPHMLILGTSGSGKSYTIRRAIRSIVKTAQTQGEQPPRFHVFDVQGDMHLEGMDSSIVFSEQTQYGINPLVVDPDPHYGGVRKRVEALIDAINQTSNRLGHRQIALLRGILMRLYERRGFLADDPSTWTESEAGPDGAPKRFPTLSDLADYIELIRTQLEQYADERGASLLIQLNRQIDSIARRGQKLERGDMGAKALDRFESDIDDLYENFRERITQLKNGSHPRELEAIQSMGANPDTLAALQDSLGNFLASGIFKNQSPAFDHTQPVWRYDIKPLESKPEIQRTFIQFRLEELFRRASAEGLSDHVHTIIVIDEAHRFMDKDGGNMINRIAKEGRKFGVGMVAASQSPKHFSEDFLSLVATKLFLKIDESFWQLLNNKMRVPVAALRWLAGGTNMVAQIKRSDATDGTNDYRPLYVKKVER